MEGCIVIVVEVVWLLLVEMFEMFVECCVKYVEWGKKCFVKFIFEFF